MNDIGRSVCKGTLRPDYKKLLYHPDKHQVNSKNVWNVWRAGKAVNFSKEEGCSEDKDI